MLGVMHDVLCVLKMHGFTLLAKIYPTLDRKCLPDLFLEGSIELVHVVNWSCFVKCGTAEPFISFKGRRSIESLVGHNVVPSFYG